MIFEEFFQVCLDSDVSALFMFLMTYTDT